MPIDYRKYPKNWKELREKVLERANNCCEFCGVKNHSIGYRDGFGTFIEVENTLESEAWFYDDDKTKFIKIVLTVAHLDHDEENENVKLSRLAALCQRCHLIYDVPEKKRRRKKKKAIGDLFDKPLKEKK